MSENGMKREFSAQIREFLGNSPHFPTAPSFIARIPYGRENSPLTAGQADQPLQRIGELPDR
jgi:hypothetical protein